EIQIELGDEWALGSTKIQVYEVNGNRIYKGTIKGNHYRINTEVWPPGMYYVEMMKGSQKVIQKVIKL
nr:T9SS type A sorting domain-containing protein [Chitinophagaceae bacterium]